ncbi:DUF5518 domain-containing protein [Halobaculum magnesiiphilum]|uniref:DUF5518 domain-containing protein n=1 Tax=Halobaculum magnesiiphilum TaxID=1017351 RepID=A0A8T8W9D7_9EURY|nr:DUF5518 domain-containing protein [Halobaculum magnesiiphilum]QZP36394.1 DUF5518 domain-containing protein [Halobaculum magnesiiphilum]
MSSSDMTALKHAAIGAAVSLVTFFLPFSPVIGGGVAGYLHGPDRTEGAKVGGLSGLLAAVPGAVIATLIASVFVIVGPGQRSGLLVAFALFLVLLLVGALYGGALGAVGGLVGALLNEEFDGPNSTPARAGDPTTLRDDRSESDDEPRSELTEFDDAIGEPNRS